MKGRRLEMKVSEETGRVDLNLSLPVEPGDYVGPLRGYTGDAEAVFFRLPVAADHPDAGIRHVCSPPHSFREDADGTLTISPSILAIRPGSAGGWHGYLERGVWREV